MRQKVMRSKMLFLKPLFFLLVFSGGIFQDFTLKAQNAIGGIGARLGLDTVDGTTLPVIVGVIANSPAAKELKEKLFILKVNDVDCHDKKIEDVVGLIRGEIGSQIKVTVSDTRDGKTPVDHQMVRASITFADPVTSFNESLDLEVKQMKKQGKTIVKTYTSDCGNYYFNFNAEPRLYHVRVLTYEENNKGAYKQGYEGRASVFDNDNEAGAVALAQKPTRSNVDATITELEGELSFKKDGVGTISIKVKGLDDIARCKAMYIIVYTGGAGK